MARIFDITGLIPFDDFSELVSWTFGAEGDITRRSKVNSAVGDCKRLTGNRSAACFSLQIFIGGTWWPLRAHFFFDPELERILPGPPTMGHLFMMSDVFPCFFSPFVPSLGDTDLFLWDALVLVKEYSSNEGIISYPFWRHGIVMSVGRRQAPAASWFFLGASGGDVRLFFVDSARLQASLPGNPDRLDASGRRGGRKYMGMRRRYLNPGSPGDRSHLEFGGRRSP